MLIQLVRFRTAVCSVNIGRILNMVRLAVNTGKTKYMEIERHRGMIANEQIRIGSNSIKKVKTLKY